MTGIELNIVAAYIGGRLILKPKELNLKNCAYYGMPNLQLLLSKDDLSIYLFCTFKEFEMIVLKCI